MFNFDPVIPSPVGDHLRFEFRPLSGDHRMSNSRPNIIVLITDDQGYGDLSCMGATGFRTPNIDGLANELSSLAMEWRGGIEERWERDYAGLEQSVQTSAMV